MSAPVSVYQKWCLHTKGNSDTESFRILAAIPLKSYKDSGDNTPTQQTNRFKEKFYLDKILVLSQKDSNNTITNGIIGAVKENSKNAKYHNLNTRLSRLRLKDNNNVIYNILNDAGLNTKPDIVCKPSMEINASQGLAGDTLFDLKYPNKVRVFLNIKSAYYCSTTSYGATIKYGSGVDTSLSIYDTGINSGIYNSTIPQREFKVLKAYGETTGTAGAKFILDASCTNHEGEYTISYSSNFWEDYLGQLLPLYPLKSGITIDQIDNRSDLDTSKDVDDSSRKIGDIMTAYTKGSTGSESGELDNIPIIIHNQDNIPTPSGSEIGIYKNEYLSHINSNDLSPGYYYTGAFSAESATHLIGKYWFARFLLVTRDQGNNYSSIRCIVKKQLEEVTADDTEDTKDKTIVSIMGVGKQVGDSIQFVIILKVRYTNPATMRGIKFNYTLHSYDSQTSTSNDTLVTFNFPHIGVPIDIPKEDFDSLGTYNITLGTFTKNTTGKAYIGINIISDSIEYYDPPILVGDLPVEYSEKQQI